MTMIISATLFSTSALGCAISADFTQLVVYRIIGGVGIGVVSIVSPLYISEVAVAQQAKAHCMAAATVLVPGAPAQKAPVDRQRPGGSSR